MGRKRNGKISSNGRGELDKAVKSICDIMRRGNCAGALQYVPELTWILFLRILDERETREQQHHEALGLPFRPSVESPYRWQDWAAPPLRDEEKEGHPNPEQGWKRAGLFERGPGFFFSFVNGTRDETTGKMVGLLPYLKGLKNLPDATPRMKVISEVMTGVERVRVDTERNFLDVLDKVHEISTDTVDQTHVFTLSQVYEGLLLKMGEKGNDGGQFFTPREVIRAMVRAIDPQVGERVYDPSCGTGGFLAQAYEHMAGPNNERVEKAEELEDLKTQTFWGREKENLIYPIALANLVLHGIDRPNLWHGNTLTGNEAYGGLFEGAPGMFDVILTNPPFGGKEGKEAQTNFDYKTSATQVLFLQHVLRSLQDDGGRCGIVLDEGLLYRTNEDAFTRTKKKMLDECEVWCVVSLPEGVFNSAGATVKTNLLFFTKGEPTRKIWYYDLSDLKIRKKTPLTIQHFEEFFKLLPQRADSELSWTVDLDARKAEAAKEAKPFHATAEEKRQQAAQWRERVKELKKAKPRDEAAIKEATERQKTADKETREAAAKAREIEDAVYDLKAVNPNKKPEIDTRMPAELLDVIEQKGQEVLEALALLRKL